MEGQSDKRAATLGGTFTKGCQWRDGGRGCVMSVARANPFDRINNGRCRTVLQLGFAEFQDDIDERPNQAGWLAGSASVVEPVSTLLVA